MSQIQLLPSSKLDKFKWDNCITASSNNLIYARSFYLDHMADNWHGIIVDDYESVMPVPWRKKFGIRYSYHVPFIQQLGYFTTTKVDPQILLKVFSGFIPYGQYNFNYSNTGISYLPGVKTINNFIIELSDQETIKRNFSQGFLQSLKHAEGNDLNYSDCDPDEAIELYRDLYKTYLNDLSNNDFNNLKLLFKVFMTRNQCIARKITNKKGDTLSVVVLVADTKRLYNIINATGAEGRKTEANYLLYDRLFSEFAGKGLMIDLEGSELPGVKSFYKKMGAVAQPYFRMHINNLPFPLQMITPSARKMAGD